MRKFGLGLVVVATPFLILGAFSAPSNATPLVDDFSSDTSANYVGSDSYGCCGSFSIDTSGAGSLLIDPGLSNTYSVMHSNSDLGVGEQFRIDVGRVNLSGNTMFSMVSTHPALPDGTSEFGFRFRRDSGDGLHIETISNGSDIIGPSFPDPDPSASLTLWIDRITATQFGFYYSEIGSGSRTFVGNSSLLPSEVTSSFHVGAQTWRFLTDSPPAYAFDNLQIVPEPSTALLLGIGLSALAATRRRV